MHHSLLLPEGCLIILNISNHLSFSRALQVILHHQARLDTMGMPMESLLLSREAIQLPLLWDLMYLRSYYLYLVSLGYGNFLVVFLTSVSLQPWLQLLQCLMGMWPGLVALVNPTLSIHSIRLDKLPLLA